MFKSIRAEFSRLHYDLFLWIQLAILIVFSFYFGTNPLLKLEETFFKSLSDVSLFNLIYVAFPILSASIDMIERRSSQMILAGRTRFQIVVSKYIRYLAVYCVASLIYPLINCLYYCIPWFASLPGSDVFYILRCVGLRLMMGMAFASVPMIFVFGFRNLYIPLIFAVVYSITAIIAIPSISSLPETSEAGRILSWLPNGNIFTVMKRTAPSFEIIKAVISSAAVIVLSILASYFSFRRADLK